MFFKTKDTTEIVNMDNVTWVEKDKNGAKFHFVSGDARVYEVDMETLENFLFSLERKPTKFETGTLNVKVVNRC